MAFGHGIKATLKLNSVDLTGTLESASMDLQRELAELKLLGEDSVLRLAGLRNCTFSCNGAWDTTADAAIHTAWDGDISVACEFSPNGTIKYTVNVFVNSYNVSAGSGDKVTYTLGLSSDGDVARA